MKPDGVQRGLVGEIIRRFETKGFKLVGLKLLQASQAQAEGHYEEHRGKPFFPPLVSFFASGPIVAMVWEGEDAIATGRRMMGATKPKDSAAGTIRGDFAVTMGRNIVHGSDGVDSAKREINYCQQQQARLQQRTASYSPLSDTLRSACCRCRAQGSRRERSSAGRRASARGCTSEALRHQEKETEDRHEEANCESSRRCS